MTAQRSATSRSTTLRRRPDGVTIGDHTYRRVLDEGALVHLTRGAKASRTGFNVRALCGTSILPPDLVFPIEGLEDGRLCSKCAKVDAGSGPGYARIEADDSADIIEAKVAEAFAPVRAAREALGQ